MPERCSAFTLRSHFGEVEPANMREAHLVGKTQNVLFTTYVICELLLRATSNQP